MYETHHDSGEGDFIHTSIPIKDLEEIRADRPGCAFSVSLGYVDLPAFVSNGQLYIQAPLPLIFEAFAESLPSFLRDLEVRISDQGGRSFSLDSHGHPVLISGLAIPSLVPNRRVGR